MATYICSDIHGAYDRYKKLLEEINFSKDDELWVVGDVVDRGKSGARILNDMMKHSNMHLIIGNHEFMMLEYFNVLEKRGTPPGNSLWLSRSNGGLQTLKGLERFKEENRQKIIEYVKNAYVQKVFNIDSKKIMLCHAFYVRGKDTLLLKDTTFAVADVAFWYSPYRNDDLYMPLQFYDEADAFITGHVPTIFFGVDPPILDGNVYNIDGGCAITAFDKTKGCLCCIKLEDFFTEEPTIIIIK